MVNYKSSPSIGAIGSNPVFDEYNNRIKCFLPGIVERSTLHLAKQYIETAKKLKNEKGATRITLRFIVEKGFVIPGLKEEARIPLNNWNESRYEILYLGENDPGRYSSSENLKIKDKIVALANMKREINYNPFKRIDNQLFKIEILNSQTDEDISQIHSLLKNVFPNYTFELTEENVRKLTTSSPVVVARKRHTGEIVSVIIGEIANVQTETGELKICEYSDEATLKDYRRRGLSQACLYLLREYLYQKEHVDLIYGEVRACNIGSNIVPAKLGFKYAGRLPKHCMIGGDRDVLEEGPYEDLNVWYFPGFKWI